MLTLPEYPLRQRDFLLEISRAITARLDLQEVLRRVLHASVVMTAARVGIVVLRNEEDGLFYVRAYTGIQHQAVPQINKMLHKIMHEATEGAVNYDFLNEKLGQMAQSIDESLQQSVAMPLIFAQDPMGLLIVFRSYQATVTRNDMQMLHSFADQAAIAVHNAQLYERINHERQRLAAILDHSGDGVMILDANLDILQVNRAFERMTGYPAEEALHCNVDEVILWQKIEQPDLRDALAHGWPYSATEDNDMLYVEGDLQRRDGLVLSIGITYAPLFTAEGKLANIIANIRDITNFRRAQEMQNVFISTISHELRTPVALIKGYASTLNRDDVKWDADVVRQSVQVIEEEADRLADLIEDLLTASKIQAERSVNLQLGNVRLDQLAERSLERISTQSQIHEFVMSFQEDFPCVQGDAKKLRQVIDNLLTNAIKYSPQGGTITIGGRYDADQVTLFVRDEGEGIPETEKDRIFERFYRVDGKLTTKTKGTGLGLYLVRAIIEAHGGRIHVKSQPGQGSTFFFTLPRD